MIDPDHSPTVASDARIAEIVLAELLRARAMFGPMASAHEGYAVILEELDELWWEVKHGDDREAMAREAIQVAAMAIRFVADVCARAALAEEDDDNG